MNDLRLINLISKVELRKILLTQYTIKYHQN